MQDVMIDVREPDEFSSARVPGSINIPLSQLSLNADGILNQYDGKKITLLCRTGRRAQMALDELNRTNRPFCAEIYDGGIEAGVIRGLTVQRSKSQHLPIMRQVQIGAGSLVLLGVGLSLSVSSNFIFLSAFVGAGLVFAGVSGFCGMAKLLELMPWNRTTTSRQNVCQK